MQTFFSRIFNEIPTNFVLFKIMFETLLVFFCNKINDSKTHPLQTKTQTKNPIVSKQNQKLHPLPLKNSSKIAPRSLEEIQG